MSDFTAVEIRAWVRLRGRFISLRSRRDVTEPVRIADHGDATLRHALRQHGLPVSGTKSEQAVRLANAGVSAEHVETWHTWRGRGAGPCSAEQIDVESARDE